MEVVVVPIEVTALPLMGGLFVISAIVAYSVRVAVLGFVSDKTDTL